MAKDRFHEYPKSVLVGVGLFLSVAALFIVALRLFVRSRLRANVGIDDYFIVVAVVLCTAAGVILVLAAEIGGLGQQQILGPDGELIHTSQLSNYEKCRYSSELVTTLNLGIIKISILLFYRRLFIVKSFAIASAIMIGVVAAWTAAFEAAMIAQCSPPRLFWELFEIDYTPHCINVQMMYLGLAASDLILDVTVLAFPIPMVIFLQLPWRKKIAILDIFLLGTVVLASGIARIVSFMQVVGFTTSSAEVYFKNTTYYTAGPLFWLFAENAVAIIGACLPTIAPLWSGTSKSSKQRSKAFSTIKNFSDKIRTKDYDDIDSRFDGAGQAEDASERDLVLGPPPVASATRIYADNIGLPNWPRDRIQVKTTLSAAAVQR